MHNFHCLAARLSRHAADTIDVLLNKMHLVDQSLPQPATAQTMEGAARIASNLDSAKRAYISNRHALISTDTLLAHLNP